MQDRIIRLEEQLRLERLLPPERRDAIYDVDTELLIGLRFASDGEVAQLFDAIVTEGIIDRGRGEEAGDELAGRSPTDLTHRVEHESPSGGTTASDPSPNHGFEAEIILRIVQTLDRWYLGVQNLARSVGILGFGAGVDSGLRGRGSRVHRVPGSQPSVKPRGG